MNFVSSFFTSLLILTVFSVYLYVQNGIFSLFILNKAIGQTALFLFAFVLLIGVLTRIFDFFDGLLKFRKLFGLLIFGYVSAHFLISFFLLPDQFPSSRFVLTNVPFVLGLSSILILFVLTIFSFNIFIQFIDRKRWWKLQNWGVRLAAVFGLLHVVIMKDRIWWNWLTGSRVGNVGVLPPLGLVIGCFFVFALLVRLSEFLGKTLSKILVVTLFVVLAVIEVWFFLK